MNLKTFLAHNSHMLRDWADDEKTHTLSCVIKREYLHGDSFSDSFNDSFGGEEEFQDFIQALIDICICEMKQKSLQNRYIDVSRETRSFAEDLVYTISFTRLTSGLVEMTLCDCMSVGPCITRFAHV